ncbi:MAG TPA: DUF3105 domain-containing protein [Dehalococcoidia bacterium]|nr:DUF3105 domain-containing protein [Dehalococcoidia bacterium]
MSQDSNRRRRRQQRRREREAQADSRPPALQEVVESAPPGQSMITGIRETIDSFGGFLTIGAVGGTVLIIIYLIIQNPLASTSPLLGDARDVPAGVSQEAHTTNAADMVGRPGEPPAIGPHFGGPECVPPSFGNHCGPAPYGIYDFPVNDGNAVHSLEHGMVWISYNPELVTAEMLATLEEIANDRRRDVILSPRPQNGLPIYAVSWGRVLAIDGTAGVEEALLRDFVTTNNNRSPEPKIRGAGHR